MRILILGSQGQVGSSIKEVSTNYNHHFIFLSRKECDISDLQKLKEVIKINKPEFIVNCTAFTNVDDSEIKNDDSNLINNTVLVGLSKICLQNNIVLFHISTDYVFGSSEAERYKKPMKENDKTNPINFYGKTKLHGENNSIKSGCKFLILRTSWVFGPYGNNFLKTMLNIAKTNESVSVINDQEGCPTYSIDIANAIINLIESVDESDFNQILHFSGDQRETWYSFAEIIFSFAKKNELPVPINLIPISSSDYKSLAKRPSYSVLDSEKIKKYYNIHPSKIEDAIEETINRINLT